MLFQRSHVSQRLLKRQKGGVKVKLSGKKKSDEEKREFIAREKFELSHIDAIF